VKNGKQTLLVRFFRWEIADYILRSKKMLKNTPCSMFEDATQLNQNLLFELKDRPEVEAAWILGGAVWAILQGSTKKIKVSINDNLDVKLSQATHTAPHQTPPHPTVIHTPSQQANSQMSLTSSSPLNDPFNDPLNLSTSSRPNPLVTSFTGNMIS
jgi:hypothetical protein